MNIFVNVYKMFNTHTQEKTEPYRRIKTGQLQNTVSMKSSWQYGSNGQYEKRDVSIWILIR